MVNLKTIMANPQIHRLIMNANRLKLKESCEVQHTARLMRNTLTSHSSDVAPALIDLETM